MMMTGAVRVSERKDCHFLEPSQVVDDATTRLDLKSMQLLLRDLRTTM